MKKASFAIPSKNRFSFLQNSIEHINKVFNDIDKEIIVVYYKLDKTQIDWLLKNNIVAIEENKNSNVIKAHNQAFKRCSGEYTFLWSDDISIGGNFTGEEGCINFLDNNKNYAGIAYPWQDFDIKKFANLHGKHQPILRNHIAGLHYNKGDRPFLTWGPVRSSVMKEVDYWDERYTSYYASPDMNLKLYEAGYDIKLLDYCFMVHNENFDDTKQINYNSFKEDELLFKKKWSNLL